MAIAYVLTPFSERHRDTADVEHVLALSYARTGREVSSFIRTDRTKKQTAYIMMALLLAQILPQVLYPILAGQEKIISDSPGLRGKISRGCYC
jgi:hypothetical protein